MNYLFEETILKKACMEHFQYLKRQHSFQKDCPSRWSFYSIILNSSNGDPLYASSAGVAVAQKSRQNHAYPPYILRNKHVVVRDNH